MQAHADAVLQNYAALLQIGQAAFQLVVGNLQVNHVADLGKMLHGLVGIDRRTARRDDRTLGLQIGEHLVLDGNEPFGAARVEQLLQRLVALILNHQVGVDKVVTDNLREHDAQS